MNKQVDVWMTSVSLGEVLINLGRSDEAEMVFQEILDQVPADKSRKLWALATFGLARVRASQGNAEGRTLANECLRAFEAMRHAEAVRVRDFLRALSPPST